MRCYSKTFKALGGPCEFRSYADSADVFQIWCSKLIGELERIEKKYSAFIDTSIIGQINRNAGIQATVIDGETYQLLNYARLLWQLSEGKFDISAAPLIKLWDFKRALIPSEYTIQEALMLVGLNNSELTDKSFYLQHKNMQINLGGFGKEYAVDRCIAILRENACKYGLVNLSGDVAVTGSAPGDTAWHIGIQHPRRLTEAIELLYLKSGSIATSGDYERYFEKNGQRYCHIINAKTGWPVQAYASISVLAASCLSAGSVATLAMLEEENAAQWLHQDNRLHCNAAAVSEGINVRIPALLINAQIQSEWLNR